MSEGCIPSHAALEDILDAAHNSATLHNADQTRIFSADYVCASVATTEAVMTALLTTHGSNPAFFGLSAEEDAADKEWREVNEKFGDQPHDGEFDEGGEAMYEWEAVDAR